MSSRPYIELYINGHLVEFKEPPRVFITYAHNELHNPTVVKNSYSKTLTIDGTPNNNKIFNAFYDNKWISGAGFNPARKETFELYRNGEIMESGYVKLDKVRKNNNTVQYHITLYGGLGQFLYSLSYAESGDELKLKDLIYPFNLDFEVNKDTIWEAWKHIMGIGTTVSPISEELNPYDFINFAPCYNGIPKDFTANKVAINAAQLPEDFKVETEKDVKDDGKYGTVNGWIMGELSTDLDEWKTKDLRSYLQRPVVRVKEIINACCNPENNGGYEVDLDKEFFNDDNPYWNDAWLTLPLLTEIESEAGNGTANIMANSKIEISGVSAGEKIRVKTKVIMGLTAESDADVIKTGRRWYKALEGMDDFYQERYNNIARCVQLVACNKDGKPVLGGKPEAFYTKLNSDKADNFSNSFWLTTLAPITPNYGVYNKQGDGVYLFENGKEYTLEIDIVYEEGMYFRIDSSEAKNSNTALFGETYNCLWAKAEKKGKEDKEVNTYGYTRTDFKPEVITLQINTRLDKNTLLNSEHTPCDYFLSYLKMFNLHIWKDMYDKKIYVYQRKNFFTNEFYDLDDVVDRGNDITITPLTFDAKWYNFQLEMDNSGMLYKDYKSEYGLQYGIQKVDTNYNFDNSSKNLFEGNVYKSCIMQKGKSRFYTSIFNSDYSEINPMPSYWIDGMQTYLYNDKGETTEGTYINPKTSINSVQWGNSKNTDITAKPSFVDNKNEMIDGANVLLFFSGKQEMKDVNNKYLKFHLTDNITEFDELNEGEPMWIMTFNQWDKNGNDIAVFPSYLPVFSRYITNENNWITHSWDFGTPKSVYIDNINIDESSSLYYKFWKPYIQDMYSVNTRTLDCKVLLKERVIGDWLRRWYYFDGAFWILNEITDYDVTSNDTTKCTFIRVNNTENYLT